MGTDASFTRRNFLMLVAQTGGAGAALAALDALGGMPLAIGAEHRYDGPPQLSERHGNNQRVTILGAGIAGLVSALQLGRAGFTCTVLEARPRPGGRVWTIRGGDRIEQLDGIQRAVWPNAPHLYMNAGPARIPHHHRALLGYCREFNVPLEIMMNDDRAALMQDDAAFDGKPVEAKQVINDTRGYLGELLGKALASGGLDRELSREDLERLREAVAAFADLQDDGRYTGSARSGYLEPPGTALDFGTIRKPLSLQELLKADFWQFKASFGESYEMASTMLQPVGGMDQIPKAIAKRLGNVIRYGTVVDEIRKTATGARVICHRGSGPKLSIESDFIVCTLPLSVLKNVPNDLSPAHQQAIAECRYGTPAKIAFYAPRRFWEEDHGIYGGISWTSREITQILYPSHGIGQKDGVLVGSYTFGRFPGDDQAQVSVPERLSRALASGERLHPGYAHLLRAGISVAWSNVPHNLGGWAVWEPEQKAGAYRTLLEPDGPIHLAGEHLSNLMSWQEGAILSAHRAVEAIAKRVRA